MHPDHPNQKPLPLWRKGLILALLFVALAIGFYVAVLPNVKPDKPGIKAILCVIFAAVLGGRSLWKAPKWHYVIVLLPALLMVPFIVIARAFRSVDMMALAFHTNFGIKGATLAGLENEILAATLSMIIVIVSALFTANLLAMPRAVYGALGTALLLSNPLVQFQAKRFFFPPPNSDLAMHYVDKVILTPSDPLPDLLIVYLEGSDRQYEDTSIFGDAFAPIIALKPDALAFTRIAQIAGTGWSVAGMVASQCGVPALPKGLLDARKMDVVEQFMPSVTCLGDLLAPLGYSSEFVVGSQKEFGGILKLYNNHAVEAVIGWDEIKAVMPKAEFDAADLGWVLDDQILFDAARISHTKMLADPNPYALIIQTTGPHGKSGLLARICAADGRAQVSNDMRLMAHCTASLATAFIKEAQQLQAARGRPLRILLLSDHLSHAGTLPGVGSEFAGFNTVMMIGGPGAGEVNDAFGAMTDIFPTFLEWAGLAQSPVAAGIGRSLLSDPPSLLAERGLPVMDAMLFNDAALADKIWE